MSAHPASPQGRAGALTCPDCGGPVCAWDERDGSTLLACPRCGRCEYRHDITPHPMVFSDKQFAQDAAEITSAGVTGKRRRKLARRLQRFADTKLRPDAPHLPQPGTTDHHGRPLAPTWEGVHSFKPVWDACWRVVADAPRLGRGHERNPDGSPGTPLDVISGAEAFALQGIYALHAAHALWIGPQQLDALPDADPFDLIEWGRATSLPFPTMYLDFTSATGPAELQTSIQGHTHQLYGAIVFNPVTTSQGEWPAGSVQHGAMADGDLSLGALHRGQATATDGLTIIPFGAGMRFPDDELRAASWGDNEPSPLRSPLGAFTLESERLDASDVVTGDLGVGNTSGSDWLKGQAVVMARIRVCDIINGVTVQHDLKDTWVPPVPVDRDLGVVLGGTGGVLQSRLEQSGSRDFPAVGAPGATLDFDLRTDAEIATQADIILRCGLQVLKALYLLDSANVELDEAPVSRPVRKQAKKRGHRIAKVVRVHLGHRRAKQPTSSGGSRNFTHRFDRRGFYRHVTRGPHYREPFIKPCTRHDDAHNATGGFCRREWVPPTVVGDEELPYVPKARIWQQDQPQEDG